MQDSGAPAFAPAPAQRPGRTSFEEAGQSTGASAGGKRIPTRSVKYRGLCTEITECVDEAVGTNRECTLLTGEDATFDPVIAADEELARKLQAEFDRAGRFETQVARSITRASCLGGAPPCTPLSAYPPGESGSCPARNPVKVGEEVSQVLSTASSSSPVLVVSTSTSDTEGCSPDEPKARALQAQFDTTTTHLPVLLAQDPPRIACDSSAPDAPPFPQLQVEHVLRSRTGDVAFCESEQETPVLLGSDRSSFGLTPLEASGFLRPDPSSTRSALLGGAKGGLYFSEGASCEGSGSVGGRQAALHEVVGQALWEATLNERNSVRHPKEAWGNRPKLFGTVSNWKLFQPRVSQAGEHMSEKRGFLSMRLSRVEGEKPLRKRGSFLDVPGNKMPSTLPPHEIADFKVLEDLLRLNGMKPLYTESDGNCQFRAIAHQLYNDSKMHSFVRRSVVQQLQSHRTQFSIHITGSFEDYLEHMSKEGTRGDRITLQAAADKFGVKVTLLTSNADCPVVDIAPQGIMHKKDITLCCFAGRHYSSVQTVSRTSKWLQDQKRAVHWMLF